MAALVAVAAVVIATFVGRVPQEARMDAYSGAMRRGSPTPPWQSWALVLGAVVVGCVLVASRVRPVAIVGVVVVVIALLIVARMAIEAFGRSRR